MNKRGMGEKVVVVKEEECSVIVGEDGGAEWGERMGEACEQEGDGDDLEEGECSVIVGVKRRLVNKRGMGEVVA